MPKNPKTKIDPNEIKVRDPLMVKIINGVTKASVEPDRKKEESRRGCRLKIRYDED